MSALRLTADTAGNVIAHLSITCPAEDAVTITPLAGGLVLFEIGADEPCQVQFTISAELLVDVLSGALADALRHLDGDPEVA